MIELLRSLEWSVYGACPSCRQVSSHAPDCRLDRAIRDLAEGSPGEPVCACTGPDRRAHRQAVADVARLQRKLAEVRAAMARTIRRSVRKPVFDLAAWVGRSSDDIAVDDPVESTCTPGELESLYQRLLDLRLKAPPNVYRRGE